LATVNGRPITEVDVEYWLAKNTQGRITKGSPEQVKNVLEAIIGQELIYQKAVELGLDQTADYQRMVREKQAELASFRRTAIRQLYYDYKAREGGKVTEAEAKAFFDQHADKIRTRYHIYQVFRSSEPKIREVEHALAAGKSFEEAAGFEGARLPEGQKPWDIGSLNWLQVPAEWRDTLDELPVGQESGVIQGENSRQFWIIKIIDKQPDPSVTFDGVKEAVITTLERDKVRSMRANLEQQLRNEAQIVYVEDPAAGPGDSDK